jgi:hypothetical protein
MAAAPRRPPDYTLDTLANLALTLHRMRRSNDARQETTLGGDNGARPNLDFVKLAATQNEGRRRFHRLHSVRRRHGRGLLDRRHLGLAVMAELTAPMRSLLNAEPSIGRRAIRTRQGLVAD